MKTKHLRPQTVNLLRNLKMKLRITDQAIADHIGISRCYVNLMLNHKHPFCMKYYEPMDEFLRSKETMV